MGTIYCEPSSSEQRTTQQLFAGVTPSCQSFQAGDGVSAMAVMGDQMWVGLKNGGIEIRNVHTGVAQHAFAAAHRPAATTRIWCLLPVEDGLSGGEQQMWVGLSTGTIDVYDGQRHELIRQLRKHVSGVYCLASDAGMVYSGSSDFSIAQWRVADGQLLRVLKGHGNYVRCLYSEGMAVISGSDDRTIRIWHRDTGEPIGAANIHAQSGGVSALCRVGVTMWSGDDTGAVAVWQLPTCKALLLSRNHTGRITTIQKIGGRVYVGAADGCMGVYDALDGTLIQKILSHIAHVTAVQCAVEVDRYFVWTGAADNTVRCWHHDEHIPMNANRERFNDMRWYYTTQQPFREVNEKLLDEHRSLSELVVLSLGTEDAVQNFLANSNEQKQSAAVRFCVLEEKLKEGHRQQLALDEKRRALQTVLDQKKQALEAMQANLAIMAQAKAAISSHPTVVGGPVSAPLTTLATPVAPMMTATAAPVQVAGPPPVVAATPPSVPDPSLLAKPAPIANVVISNSYEPVRPKLPPPPPPAGVTEGVPLPKAVVHGAPVTAGLPPVPAAVVPTPPPTVPSPVKPVGSSALPAPQIVQSPSATGRRYSF